MNVKSKLETIDIQNREFSLLFINPRRAYLDWLISFAKSRGLEATQLGVPEECTTLIIPRISRFSLPGELQQFTDLVKPAILSVELYSLGATIDDLGHPLCSETFDMFFEIGFRDEVSLVTEIMNI